MIKVAIFDLDDTLYNELDFVKSGYLAVAREISRYVGMKTEDIYLDIWALYYENKEFVFDRLLKLYGINNQYSPEMLLHLYRNHKSNIKLFRDAQYIIKVLKNKGISLAIITDGNYVSQENKIRSLNLASYFDLIVYTDKFGKEYWKPHPRAYKLVLDYFKVKSYEACYIGDNPIKDFIAPNKLGMQTYQIIRSSGLYSKFTPPNEGKPNKVIYSLEELEELIL
ncbi:haloacid dehalogenase [Moorella thermoacetica]|uniref:Haloacid dehalogenase-like hydrolase n=1 Tax=Moorella thermoacetica (strain ATCC 39073 / JCM 9320) TaxID=264732 RepID=Q2RKG7_MOOTA|nr:HAD family hydrolase [Moorella thermoacetica]AKX93502.1 phosphoglycolate phosphatase [Moorella thermoacetica]AKX96149.1 phosphoglycolate phosphatase [Moorella thermoacetica]OIQ55361.1 phosphoglycolate phosphatase [Moorella thermoacetica]QCZ99959.1 Phosphoglycolate phosphatase [Moorella thermoacetica]TYL07387.1 Pyrophosphatase PpaX [Moorella thermoacetica]